MLQLIILALQYKCTGVVDDDEVQKFQYATANNVSYFVSNNVFTIPCGVESVGNQINNYQDKSELTGIFIPDTVYQMSCICHNCINLKSVLFSNQMLTIESQSFVNCTSLESIIIPVYQIESEAFVNCNKLSCVQILNRYCKIANDAFVNSSVYNGLTNVETSFSKTCEQIFIYIDCDQSNPQYKFVDIKGDSHCVDTKQQFFYYKNNQDENIVVSQCPYDKNFYIQEKEIDHYQCINKCPENMNYYQITLTRQQMCLSSCYYRYTNLNCYIIKTECERTSEEDIINFVNANTTGDIDSFVENNVLTIPCGVATIDNQIYNYKQKAQLTNVIIPNSVNDIKGFWYEQQDEEEQISSPFKGCTQLKSIKLPESLTKFKVGSFAYSNLQQIELPNGLTEISEGLFAYCEQLPYIHIPESVTSVKDWAFIGCKNLKAVELPSSITKILYQAFSNCISLESINIPESVVEIDEQAFANCNKLNCVYIANSQCKINESAFENVTNFQDQTSFNNSECQINIYVNCKNNQDEYIQYVNGEKKCIDGQYLYYYELNDKGERIYVETCEKDSQFIHNQQQPYLCSQYCSEKLTQDSLCVNSCDYEQRYIQVIKEEKNEYLVCVDSCSDNNKYVQTENKDKKYYYYCKENCGTNTWHIQYYNDVEQYYCNDNQYCNSGYFLYEEKNQCVFNCYRETQMKYQYVQERKCVSQCTSEYKYTFVYEDGDQECVISCYEYGDQLELKILNNKYCVQNCMSNVQIEYGEELKCTSETECLYNDKVKQYKVILYKEQYCIDEKDACPIYYENLVIFARDDVNHICKYSCNFAKYGIGYYVDKYDENWDQCVEYCEQRIAYKYIIDESKEQYAYICDINKIECPPTQYGQQNNYISQLVKIAFNDDSSQILCVQKCSDAKQYQLVGQNNNKCIDSCQNVWYKNNNDGENICTIDESCPPNGQTQLVKIANKQCVNKCKNSYEQDQFIQYIYQETLNSNKCVEFCFYYTVQNDDNICVDGCSDNQLQVQIKDSYKYQCIDQTSCPNNGEIVYIKNEKQCLIDYCKSQNIGYYIDKYDQTNGQCQKECGDNVWYYQLINGNKVKVCDTKSQKCPPTGITNLNKQQIQQCVEKCDKEKEYFYNKADNQGYYYCQDGIKGYLDSNDELICSDKQYCNQISDYDKYWHPIEVEFAYCVSKCESTYWQLNLTEQFCVQQCDENQLIANIAEGSNQCVVRCEYSKNNKLQYQQEKQCVEQCTGDYYKLKSQKVCSNTCTYYLSQGQKVCLESENCSQGQYMVKEQRSYCTVQCPQNKQFIDNNVCVEQCDSNSQNSFAGVNKVCQASCNVGNVWMYVYQTKQCLSQSHCENIQIGKQYKLVNGECKENLCAYPQNFYNEQYDSEEINCLTQCMNKYYEQIVFNVAHKVCSDRQQCRQLVDYSYVSNNDTNLCVSSCGRNVWVENNQQNECRSSEQCGSNEFLIEQTKQCVTQCPEYLAAENQKCVTIKQQSTQKSSEQGLIVGISIIAVIVVAEAVAIVVICLKKKQAPKNNKQKMMRDRSVMSTRI